MGNEGVISSKSWPSYDEVALKRDELEIVVQVNGKTRDKIMVSATLPKDEIEAMVMELESVKKWIEGMTVRKVIFVPGRLVNIAAS